MTQVVDLAKAPPIPPAAKPVNLEELIGRMPMPSGVVKMQTVSPAEQKRLQELGVHETNVLPDNLIELSDAAKNLVLSEIPTQEELDEDALQDTLTRVKGHKTIDPKEIDVRDLPPQQRAVYESILGSVLKGARQQAEASIVPEGMNPSVHQAVQAANAPRVVNDTNSPTYATGMAKDAPVPAAVETPTPVGVVQTDERSRICARCGFPKDKAEDLTITEDDKSAFFQSIICLQPYVKTFKLFNGKAWVTVRTLTPSEIDTIFRQVNLDGRLGIITSFPEEIEFTARYRLALQLVEVVTPEKTIKFPTSLEAWPLQPKAEAGKEIPSKLPAILSQVMTQIGTNEALYRILATVVSKFNIETQKMEKLVSDADFYKAIGT